MSEEELIKRMAFLKWQVISNNLTPNDFSPEQKQEYDLLQIELHRLCSRGSYAKTNQNFWQKVDAYCKQNHPLNSN